MDDLINKDALRGDETPQSYGSLYKMHYLAQYKVFISTINHNNDIRQTVNNYFLTLNTLLLAGIGISLSERSPILHEQAVVAFPAIGIIICLIWYAIIYSYKQRSIVKQMILRNIERDLPLSMYTVEWETLKQKHGGLKFHFFAASLFIPWTFVLLYAFIIVLTIFG